MSDPRLYEAACLAEMLRSDGWKVVKARFTTRLELVRRSILKGRWVTPEQMRELAYLQGEEAFLDKLVNDAGGMLAALGQPEPEPEPEAHRVAPGRKTLGRARPVGE